MIAAEHAEQERLADDQRKHFAVGEAERLQDRKLGIRSRTDCIMVLPVRNSRVKNTAPRIARSTKPDIAELLDERDRKILGGLGLGLVGRIREQGVDLVGDDRGLRRIGDALLEPADVALAEAAALVEQLVVEQHGSRTAALCLRRVLRIESADDVEGPVKRAVRLLRPDGRVQRQLVADLPAEFLHQRHVDQRAGARVAERLHLPVADDELVLVQVEIAVGVDRAAQTRSSSIPDNSRRTR